MSEYGKNLYLTESDRTAILVAFVMMRQGRKRAIEETKAHLAGKWSINKKIMQNFKKEWYDGLEHDMKDLEKKIGTNQLERWGKPVGDKK